MTRATNACLALAAAVCLAAPNASAQTPAAGSSAAQAPPRPAVGTARPFTPAPRQERTLPNGVRVVVARHGSIPKVTAMLVVSGAGLAADPAGRIGLASFTAEALLEGTASRTSAQIRTEAFGMGGSITSSSAQDFSLVEARGLSEYLSGVLGLLADVAMNPSFPDDELASLKARQMQQLLQQQASPQFLSNRTFRQALFGEHPYSRITAKADDLKGLERATLASFHAAQYRPQRATLIVVGDVQADAVFKAAEHALGGWTPRRAGAPGLPKPQPLAGRTLVFLHRPGSVQSSISFGNLSIERSHPRWYALSLTNTLLGGSFNSRLTRKLREEKGYTYSPASQFNAFASAGFYRFAADVRNEVTGAAIRDMQAEMERLQTEGATPQELTDIKQYARGLFAIRMAAPDLLAADLITVYVYGLPADYLETYQSKIGAVTSDDVKAAAAELVTADRSVLAIVGDWPAVKPQLSGYGEVRFVDVDGAPLEKEPGT